jgi:hypothetical protein
MPTLYSVRRYLSTRAARALPLVGAPVRLAVITSAYCRCVILTSIALRGFNLRRDVLWQQTIRAS